MENTLSLLVARRPYPWQHRLKNRLETGSVPNAVDLPTGSGKSTVMACHLAAWIDAFEAGATPAAGRRLVWIVDRRALVDDASLLAAEIARRVSENLHRFPRLKSLMQEAGTSVIPVATLRGQRAINRDWTLFPELPSIVVGTVDMLGSRLLLGGYGDGWSRATAAGLLGCDATWYVDEAHLSAPLVATLRAIAASRLRSHVPVAPLQVCEITATPAPGIEDVFRLEDDDHAHPDLGKRLRAGKAIEVRILPKDENLVKAIVKAAEQAEGPRVLVAVSSPKDAAQVRKDLARKTSKGEPPPELLTGTMRGAERESLTSTETYRAFSANPPDVGGRRYLVTTSAGEVGLDLDADSLICDAVDIDRTVQRLGRVNRTGRHDLAQVVVIKKFAAEPKKNAKNKKGEPLPTGPSPTDVATELLQEYGLPRLDVAELRADARFQKARAKPTAFLPLQEGDMELASMSSVRELPGRLPPRVFIRGTEDEAPTVAFAWRADVAILAGRNGERPADDKTVAAAMDTVPVGRHETCSVPASDASAFVTAAARSQHRDLPVLLFIDGDWRRAVLDENLAKRLGESTGDALVLLPTETGGLNGGILSGDDDSLSHPVEDVSFFQTGDDVRTFGARVRMSSVSHPPEVRKDGLTLVFDAVLKRDEEGEPSEWLAVYRGIPDASPDAATGGARAAPSLASHNARVGREARKIALAVELPESLAEAIGRAGEAHDLGKAAACWQEAAGMSDRTADPVAKSASGRFDGSRLKGYRHEIGSLVEATAWEKEPLSLHLVAAHHGRGRPTLDIDARGPFPRHAAATAMGAQRRRFSTLQDTYGIWGLAYLEAILKAADARTSTAEGATA